MPMESIDIRFAQDTEADAGRVGDFLVLFGAAYAAAHEVLGERELPLTEAAWRTLAQEIIETLHGLSASSIERMFAEQGLDARLTIQSVTFESPLRVRLKGATIWILAAVMLSGGSVKIGPIEADINALGEGISSLRSALRPASGPEARYGFMSRVVKLSKEEYENLMHYEYSEEDARGGGFQRHIVGLQARVNRTTKEIELTPSDIDWILRSGRHPERGGWQATIRKVFDRHFDFTG